MPEGVKGLDERLEEVSFDPSAYHIEYDHYHDEVTGLLNHFKFFGIEESKVPLLSVIAEGEDAWDRTRVEVDHALGHAQMLYDREVDRLRQQAAEEEAARIAEEKRLEEEKERLEKEAEEK